MMASPLASFIHGSFIMVKLSILDVLINSWWEENQSYSWWWSAWYCLCLICPQISLSPFSTLETANLVVCFHSNSFCSFLICITIAAQHQMKSDRLNTCLTYTFLSIFRRYHKEFKQWRRTFWDNAPCAENCRKKSCEICQFYLEEKTKFRDYEYKLASIRYIESMSESAPQWCLQVYIMLRQ